MTEARGVFAHIRARPSRAFRSTTAGDAETDRGAARKVEAIAAGRSYIEDVPSELLQAVSERIHARTGCSRSAERADRGARVGQPSAHAYSSTRTGVTGTLGVTGAVPL